MIARIFGISVLLLVLPFTLANSLDDIGTDELIREGNRYFAIGECQLSQLVFQRVLEREPQNATAMLGKGRALVCQGAIELGIEEYQRALQVEPNNATAHIRLAIAYRDKALTEPQRASEHLNSALQAAQGAERADSSNPSVFNIKGILLYMTEDYQGARQALEQAVALATGSDSDLSSAEVSRIQVNLGKAYRELGESQLAMTTFRRAVAANPTNHEARTELGVSYHREGQCDNAIFELEQAANLNTSSLQAVANLAISLFECGEPEQAEPHIRRALRIDEVALPALYTYLARIYLQQGRYDEAVNEAARGAVLPPMDAEAFYWLGEAYSARGDGQGRDRESACDAYERALELDTDYGDAREAFTSLCN